MACVDVRFQKRPPPSIPEIEIALRGYVSEVQKLGCPSAPQRAIVVMSEPDRPQPRLDRETDRGYAVSVGRVRGDPSGIWDLKFAALSHNSRTPHTSKSLKGGADPVEAIIGAAGASILNAEAAVLKDLA